MAPLFRRSEEHTSELQSHLNLVCRLLLEKKKKKNIYAQLKILYAQNLLQCRYTLCATLMHFSEYVPCFFFFLFVFFFFFFFNDTATTEIYTLSLHDALPIRREYAGLRDGTARRSKRASGPPWHTP